MAHANDQSKRLTHLGEISGLPMVIIAIIKGFDVDVERNAEARKQARRGHFDANDIQRTKAYHVYKNRPIHMKGELIDKVIAEVGRPVEEIEERVRLEGGDVQCEDCMSGFSKRVEVGYSVYVVTCLEHTTFRSEDGFAPPPLHKLFRDGGAMGTCGFWHRYSWEFDAGKNKILFRIRRTGEFHLLSDNLEDVFRDPTLGFSFAAICGFLPYCMWDGRVRIPLVSQHVSVNGIYTIFENFVREGVRVSEL